MSAQVAELPYVTAKSLTALGKIRTQPEDFQVDEIPAYPPTGQGTHLFVRFEKRNLTTREAVTRIAMALQANPRDAGVAGQKDKHALTTQWASFQGASPEAALALALADIRILDASLHPHKLRTGHVRANRFVLLLRETTQVEVAREVLAHLERVGVPNYYGEQRFGIGERNIARGYAMLRGEMPPPRDRFERKLLMSSVQSALFNEWLALRIQDGLFEVAVPGDVWRKESTGGLFTDDDAALSQQRMQSWEISPTGPMFGSKMRRAEGEADAREQAILASSGIDEGALARHAKYGEGTRRSARVRPLDCSCELDRQAGALRLAFELPSGAYATTLLREIMKTPVA
jgi:tRNA pseudouridine13 synthase